MNEEIHRRALAWTFWLALSLGFGGGSSFTIVFWYIGWKYRIYRHKRRNKK